MAKPETPLIDQNFQQPELFVEVGNRMVPSEAASLSEEDFVAGALQAIRASMPGPAQSEPSQMDRLIQHRRDRVEGEREDFLASQTETKPEEVVAPAVTAMALQGRLLLDDEPAPKKVKRNVVAFGRYLSRAVHDVAGEKNPSLISFDERRTMAPDVIAPMIYRERKNRDVQKGYFVDDVLLNQVEYRILPRSPKSLAIDTHAKTMGQVDIREDSDVINRADRSVTHVFEAKKPVLTEHLEELRSTRSDLERLSKEVASPGFAHVSPEEMNRLVAVTWREFDNLIHVIAVQQNWNPEQIQVAETALVASFTEGPQNQRVKNFANELRFVKRYVGSRVRIFENRLGITDKFIEASDETKTA
jgi:hypothetical protein